MQKNHFFTSNLSSSSCSFIGSLFTGLAYEVFNIFATCSSLACEVMDTDCWVQNGGTHTLLLATLKHLFLTNMTNEEKNCCVYVFSPFYQEGP